MNGRERIRAVFAGKRPDRTPCALAVYPVDLETLLPDIGLRNEVDVQFVSLPPTVADRRLREKGYPHPADTRLGTTAQVAGYARWGYHPENPERTNPLSRVRTLADLRAFPFPVPATSARAVRVKRLVDKLHRDGLAVGGCLPHLGGELLESAWRLRGLENFLLDLVERPAWAEYLLDRLADLACRNAAALSATGVDVMVLGDDVGMPGGMMVSRKTWARYFRPRLARIIAAARREAPDVRILYHSDGAMEPIVEDLMDIGVNAINPVQPEYMDAVALRHRFGTRLVLWGTVGAQTAFSFHDPGSIEREVRERVRALDPTALVLCPAYDIDEPDTRPENVSAFLRSVQGLGRSRATS